MYATHSELVDEGLDKDVPKKVANRAIELASDYIDLVTGQFFEIRDKVLRLDGGRSVYYLPMFCKELTSVVFDGEYVDPDDYVLYNRYTPDDRHNPKLVFGYTLPKGAQLLELTGKFGYVEEDGSIPRQIKKVCIKLALVEVNPITSENRQDLIDRGRIVSETTDGHSYTLANVAATGGITGDPEIDTVLSRFRRPMAMG